MIFLLHIKREKTLRERREGGFSGVTLDSALCDSKLLFKACFSSVVTWAYFPFLFQITYASKGGPSPGQPWLVIQYGKKSR